MLNNSLKELASKLQQSLGLRYKQDIQLIAQSLGWKTENGIYLRDDCAAIPDGDGYLFLAAEGM